MKGIVRQGGVWVLAFAALWTLALGAAETMRPGGSGETISYRDANAATSFDRIDDLLEEIEDGGRVTAYTQRNGRSAALDEPSVSRTVDVIWFDGNGLDIWNLPFVVGNMPGRDSMDCAIDEVTANNLFGSVDVIGKEITADGVELTVCGVFTTPTGLLALGADNGYGVAFCPAKAYTGATALNVTAYEFVSYTSGLGGGTEKAREWLMGAGISVPGTVYDRNEQFQLYKQFGSLAGWTAALILCLTLLKNGWHTAWMGAGLSLRLRRSRLTPTKTAARVFVISIGAAVALGVAGVACVYFSGFSPYIPPEYLPTKWSDLSFWKTLVTDAAMTSARLQQSAVMRPDAYRNIAVNLCCVFSLCSFVALFHLYVCIGRCVRGIFPAYAPYVWAAALLSPALGAYAANAIGVPYVYSSATVSAPFLICAVPTLLIYLNLPIKLPRFAFHSRKRNNKKPANKKSREKGGDHVREKRYRKQDRVEREGTRGLLFKGRCYVVEPQNSPTRPK